MQLSLSTAIVALAALIGPIVGQESHTVTFLNLCGFGTPILINNGLLVSTGSPFQSNAPIHGIAFLQDGVTCGPQGQNCTAVETTLVAYPGSSTRFTLSSPYGFNVPVAFSYLPDEGHDGFGSYCSDKDCLSRGVPLTVDDTAVNADMWITFCPGPSA